MEPWAQETQRILRGTLKDATRNSRLRDWRYIVGVTEPEQVVAAFVHRDAPDFAGGPIPAHIRIRLLLAIAVRTDLRGVRIAPDGVRLSNTALMLAIDDARRSKGELLLARVRVQSGWPGPHASAWVRAA